jgi:hypothetical protein
VRRIKQLEPRFIETMPDRIDPGILYVSLEYGSMIHSCACGCGGEIVLPLTPLDWSLRYDGETISVWPSVGNWSLPCRSHYIIEKGTIRWAGAWSDKQIAAGRALDRDRKQSLAAQATKPAKEADTAVSESIARAGRPRSCFAMIRRKVTLWFGRT